MSSLIIRIDCGFWFSRMRVLYMSFLKNDCSHGLLHRYLIIFGVGLIREESEDGECEGRDPFSDSGSDESVSEEGLENNTLLHPNDRLGYLYLQYFERSAPYTRVPLMDKVDNITLCRHPFCSPDPIE